MAHFLDYWRALPKLTVKETPAVLGVLTGLPLDAITKLGEKFVRGED